MKAFKLLYRVEACQGLMPNQKFSSRKLLTANHVLGTIESAPLQNRKSSSREGEAIASRSIPAIYCSGKLFPLFCWDSPNILLVHDRHKQQSVRLLDLELVGAYNGRIVCNLRTESNHRVVAELSYDIGTFTTSRFWRCLSSSQHDQSQAVYLSETGQVAGYFYYARPGVKKRLQAVFRTSLASSGTILPAAGQNLILGGINSYGELLLNGSKGPYLHALGGYIQNLEANGPGEKSNACLRSNLGFPIIGTVEQGGSSSLGVWWESAPRQTHEFSLPEFGPAKQIQPELVVGIGPLEERMFVLGQGVFEKNARAFRLGRLFFSQSETKTLVRPFAFEVGKGFKELESLWDFTHADIQGSQICQFIDARCLSDENTYVLISAKRDSDGEVFSAVCKWS